MQSLFASIATLAAVLALAECQAPQASRPPEGSPQGLYAEFCAGCHGEQLQHFKRLKSYERPTAELAALIAEGSEERGMPAFGKALSHEQIEGLALYIRNFDYADNHISQADGQAADYRIEVVVDGLEIPWGMAFLPDGDLLIAEKKGQLSRWSATGGLRPIGGLPPVRAKGQGGLLDLCLHPQYAQNGWLYIAYAYVDEAEAGNTAIIRARLSGDSLADIQPIYKALPAIYSNHHFGCRMVFDREGYLYFGNGDRGQHEALWPQQLDNPNGKIHRLHDDGRIPADNPFVGQADAVASIFSYGHRNPQGIALHPTTGDIWAHEHGPKGGDEINIIRKGLNYGWPVISYGINYDGSILTELTAKAGMEQPVHYYVPSIAPCGMAFLGDSERYPAWSNSLFIGSLRFEYLERLVLAGDQVLRQEKLLGELNSRVRHVALAPDGYLYVAVEGPGRILRILPKE